MPDHDRLHRTLQELQAQLADASELDPNSVAELEGTLDEIKLALAKRALAQGKSGDPSLTDRLGQAAMAFEGSHPTLAAATRQLVDALAQLGI